MSEDRQEEWGPWIEHDGQGCPADVIGKTVHAVFEAPDAETLEHPCLLVDVVMSCCNSWRGAEYGWSGGYIAFWDGLTGKMRWITRYRIRRPRALSDLVELVETLPAPDPIRELEDA